MRWVWLLAGLGFVACVGVETSTDEARVDRTPIIGGEPDTTSHAVIGIVINQASLCSGSLIAPNLVLTARHCIADSGDVNGAIECGVSNFSAPYPTSGLIVSYDEDLTDGIVPNTTFGVREIRTPSQRSVCGYDIALLILDENVPAASATPLVPRVDEPAETDETFDAVGFGIQNANDTSGTTAGVRMRANGNHVICVGSRDCLGSATDSEWVAESPICQGDSGGPALDLQGRVIGVTSRSNEDCTAALYTAVDSFRELIVEAALDAAEFGGYDPPSWTGASVPMMDGGMPDSGTPDSGTLDSGMSDSGTPDSGMQDSGMPMLDGGMQDSGTNDSGADSGVQDSGTDASQPDSGMPTQDSGLPDTGLPDSGVTNPGGSLGDSCTSACRDGLACYSEDGEPPGVCVPRCPSNGAACPDGYSCARSLGVCRPDEDSRNDDDDDDDDSGGSAAGCACSTEPRRGSQNFAWGAFAAAAVFGSALRRRRRSRA